MPDNFLFPALARWTALKGRLSLFGLGGGTGLVVATGQSPVSFMVASIAGLIAAYVVFLTLTTSKKAFFFGWGVGFGYFVLTLNWIVEPFLVDAARHGWMAPFALVLLPGGLALFWALAFWGARRLGAMTGAYGIAWAVMLTMAEVTRSYILTGFPWGLLAYIWAESPALYWVAWIGPHGLTFLTLLCVISTYWAATCIAHPEKRPFALLILAGLPLGGMMLTPKPSVISSDLSIVRLIQPNAGQDEKWDPAMMPVFFHRQIAFTEAAADRPPDLIVWPESAIPVLLEQGQGVLDTIGRAAGDTPVVIGVQRSEGFRYFNALAVLQNGIVQDVYDKHHLVPFGEYVPLSGIASWFGFYGFAPQEGAGFSAGPGPKVISIGALGTALPLICYEAVFPHLVGAAPDRPNVLLQITNDGWFGKFAGPQQHLAQARFRSVEQGLPMIRVANTGISAVIAPDGKVLSSLPLGKAGYLDAPVPKAAAPTLYSRSGDWPVLVLLVFGLLSTQLRLKSKFV